MGALLTRIHTILTRITTATEMSLQNSERLKQEGMARAHRAADPEWQRFMLRALKQVASRQKFFCTDDIERIRHSYDGPTTHENRALGPLMLSAKKDGLIAPTDRWVMSIQPFNHRRPVRVWRSLICR